MTSSAACLRARREPADRLQQLPRARRPHLIALATAVVCTLLAAAGAHAVPFPVSSCADCTGHGTPAAAGSVQGQVFTAWTGSATGTPSGVPARFFLANGAPRGADLLLSNSPAAATGDVAVASERSGFFVAAWSAKNGLNSEIFVQRFRRTLDPLGSPIQVSADDPGTLRLDSTPTVAALADGTFVVLWERFGPGFGNSQPSPPEVLSRRFRFRDGRALGPAQVISSGPIQASRPALCATRTGALAAAWNSADGNPPFQQNHKGVVLQRLTPGGQPLGSATVVAAPASTEDGVALACGSPSFTVVWRTNQAPASGLAIVAQRFSTAGSALGSAVVLSAGGNTRLSAPAASEDGDGNVVAAWAEGGAASAQIATRGLAANGTLGPLATATALPSSTGALAAPGVSHYGRAGSYLLVWSTGLGGPLGQRFAPGGTPLAAATAASIDPADEN